MVSPVGDVASKLEATAASFVKDSRLPGAAVGIVHGNELAWVAGVGFADVATRLAPERLTLYRIASITKTFTGTAIMQLRDAGRPGGLSGWSGGTGNCLLSTRMTRHGGRPSSRLTIPTCSSWSLGRDSRVSGRSFGAWPMVGWPQYS